MNADLSTATRLVAMTIPCRFSSTRAAQLSSEHLLSQPSKHQAPPDTDPGRNRPAVANYQSAKLTMHAPTISHAGISSILSALEILDLWNTSTNANKAKKTSVSDPSNVGVWPLPISQSGPTKKAGSDLLYVRTQYIAQARIAENLTMLCWTVVPFSDTVVTGCFCMGFQKHQIRS